MGTPLIILAASIVVLAASARIAAHHAFAAEFDGSKPVTLKGTVTKMEWINPHAWMHVDVKGSDGKVVTWMIEGGAPNALLRRGWNRNSVLPGTPVTVEGFRAKDGSNRANGRGRQEAVHRLAGNWSARRWPRANGTKVGVPCAIELSCRWLSRRRS
jgi:hypothetical protein